MTRLILIQFIKTLVLKYAGFCNDSIQSLDVKPLPIETSIETFQKLMKIGSPCNFLMT